MAGRKLKGVKHKANLVLYKNGFVRSGGGRFHLAGHPALTVSVYDRPDGYRASIRRPVKKRRMPSAWSASYTLDKDDAKAAKEMISDITAQVSKVFGITLEWPYVAPVVADVVAEKCVEEYEVEMFKAPEVDDMTDYGIVPLEYENEPETEPVIVEYRAPEPEPVPMAMPFVDEPCEDEDDLDDDDEWDDDDDEFDDYMAPDVVDVVDAGLIDKVQDSEYQPLNAVMGEAGLDQDEIGRSDEDVEAELTAQSRDKTGQYQVTQRFDSAISKNLVPLAVVGALLIGFLYFYRKHTLMAQQEQSLLDSQDQASGIIVPYSNN